MTSTSPMVRRRCRMPPTTGVDVRVEADRSGPRGVRTAHSALEPTGTYRDRLGADRALWGRLRELSKMCRAPPLGGRPGGRQPLPRPLRRGENSVVHRPPVSQCADRISSTLHVIEQLDQELRVAVEVDGSTRCITDEQRHRRHVLPVRDRDELDLVAADPPGVPARRGRHRSGGDARRFSVVALVLVGPSRPRARPRQMHAMVEEQHLALIITRDILI